MGLRKRVRAAIIEADRSSTWLLLPEEPRGDENGPGVACAILPRLPAPNG